MAMKIKTYYKDGRVKVEQIKRSYDFYELEDGYHVIPPDSVYRDRAGKMPPVVIMIDGLVAPLGSAQSVALIDKTWNNMDMTKDAGGPPSVSTSLNRMLAEFMAKFGRYMPILIVIVLVIYALLAQGDVA
jgi:hypothetical protein